MEALAEQARAAGATLRDCCYVESWRQEGEGVVVETDDGEFEAARLVLATGAWARGEFARLGVTFEVLRKLTFWYLAPDPARVLPGALPILMADTGEGFFYSIPDGQDTAEDGVKLARHDEAPEVLESALLDELEELHVEHHIDEQEELVRPTVEAFARQWLGSHLVHPGSGDLVPSDLGVVQNTYSPDRHPVIDRHPMHDRVVLAGGFSGQGFKFAPAYGRLIAELCADAPGSTAEFLRLGRFSHVAG
jgi:glycine/D-amino acid oxidase-like deaminating enzyme